LWSRAAAGGLLALAILLGGVGSWALSAEPDRKDQPGTEQPKKEPGKDQPGLRPRPALPGNDMEEIERLRDEMQRTLERLRRQLGTMPGAPLGRLPAPGVAETRLGEGRLGIRIEKPSATLIDQLDLPQGEGLVVLDVVGGSAAATAGLKPHDILLEFAGKAVPADGRAFIKMLDGVKSGVPVDATVLRKGRKETIKGVTLPEGKAPLQPPRTPQPRPVPGVTPRLIELLK
jgi:hypothetical protein